MSAAFCRAPTGSGKNSKTALANGRNQAAIVTPAMSGDGPPAAFRQRTTDTRPVSTTDSIESAYQSGLASMATAVRSLSEFHDGPGRIRTYDQGIHLAPAFPPGVDYLFTRARTVRVGAGCSSLLSRALEPSGSLCTFRRCTGGSAQGCHGITHPEGFPEFIPSTSRVSARRHLVDESPALTAVLQAQPRRL